MKPDIALIEVKGKGIRKLTKHVTQNVISVCKDNDLETLRVEHISSINWLDDL